MRFRIVEITESDINPNDPDCLMAAFKYMLENIDDGSRWMGSNTRQDCIDYIETLEDAEIVE
jgi:hypothetical protein